MQRGCAYFFIQFELGRFIFFYANFFHSNSLQSKYIYALKIWYMRSFLDLQKRAPISINEHFSCVCTHKLVNLHFFSFYEWCWTHKDEYNSAALFLTNYRFFLALRQSLSSRLSIVRNFTHTLLQVPLSFLGENLY